MDRIDTKFLMPASRLPQLLNMMNNTYKVLEINDLAGFLEFVFSFYLILQ